MLKASTKLTLFTIGYEGKSLDEFLRILSEHDIGTLLDVRRRAQSRKKGYSKTLLAQSCEKLDIAYVHERDLGTPADHMARVRESGGYNAESLDEFRAYLMTVPEPLERASELLSDNRVCLMCYEAEPLDCHRSAVAEVLTSSSEFTIEHL